MLHDMTSVMYYEYNTAVKLNSTLRQVRITLRYVKLRYITLRYHT